ncbi:MAG: PAS domain S-box protein [Natronospirillum sp.]
MITRAHNRLASPYALLVITGTLVLQIILLTRFSTRADGLYWQALLLPPAVMVLLLAWPIKKSETVKASLNAIPGVVVQVDDRGYVHDLNDTARPVVGDILLGKSLLDCLNQESSTLLGRLLTRKIEPPGTTNEFEANIGQRTFRLAVAGRSKADGMRFVQLTDISEFRAMARRLAENERRYRSLFSENPDAVFSLGLDGRFLEANHRTEILIGYSPDAIQNLDWASVVDAADRPGIRECFDAAVAGHPCSCRCQIWSQDGWQTLVHVTYLPLLVDGRVKGVFVVARDKTERYRLVEQSRLLHACLAQIKDVIIITEMDPLDEPGPRIVFANAGVERMTGYRPSELVGRSPRILQGLGTERAALDRIRQALEARQPVKEVLINYRKNGDPYWNEIEIVPLNARNLGEWEYFASVQRDITQTKQRELELQQSRVQLRRLNNAHDELLEQERGRIARDLHDELGQSLTAMKLDLGIAIQELSELPQNQLQRLQALIGFSDTIINQVREIASNLRPAMLDDLGFEAAAEWFLDQCAGRDGLDIQWQAQAQVTKHCDIKDEVATALFRLLQECMTNISRHAQATTVSVHYEESEDQASLEVWDDGVGFRPDQSGLSGLGLVGMRERVAMLGGSLDIESAPGKGARVLVVLPLNGERHD